jgi:hypothetical protein
MNRYLRALLAVLVIGIAPTCFAAQTTEQIIRDLEQQQVKAAITRDRATLERIFAPDFRIISPNGIVSTRESLLGMLTDGAAPYASALYQTDFVRDYGHIAVSVGMDTVVPNSGAMAGKTVLRRVTQVWQRQKGVWRLTLRHANIITGPLGRAVAAGPAALCSARLNDTGAAALGAI